MEAKEKKRLTIAQLKNFKGLSNLTDEEAEAGIASLEKLSVLFFELYKKSKQEAAASGKEAPLIKEIKNAKPKPKSHGTKRNAA
ncbi:MAG: hypothetical protein ACHQRM_18150 [Bacteroidia bacterium]